jgi:N-acetylmuramoyl-L-alanine amidase
MQRTLRARVLGPRRRARRSGLRRPGTPRWAAVGLLGAVLAGCGEDHAGHASRSIPAASPTTTSFPVAAHSTALAHSNPSTGRAARPTARPAIGGTLATRTVVVDPGHNGGNANAPAYINRLVPAGRGRRKPCNTTGTATAGGYSEAAFNYAVAIDLRAILQAQGARVIMTRPSNSGVGPCVDRRAAIGNAAHADAVIAIHADGAPPGGRGFHVIYPPDIGDTAPIYAASLRLAHRVHDALLASHILPRSTYLGQNGYSERDDLAGLNLSTRPAIFVELGNMDNRTDARLQTDPVVRDRLAHALATGISRFLLAG